MNHRKIVEAQIDLDREKLTCLKQLILTDIKVLIVEDNHKHVIIKTILRICQLETNIFEAGTGIMLVASSLRLLFRYLWTIQMPIMKWLRQQKLLENEIRAEIPIIAQQQEPKKRKRTNVLE
jgi:hypothetical protein